MLLKKDQKFIKSLKVKKYRTREKYFLVEGIKNVLELLQSGFEIEIIIGTKQFFEEHQLTRNVRSEEVKGDLLTQLGTFKTNEGAIAVAKMEEWDLSHLNRRDHLFVLDGVSDPGNFGAIVRTLDWFNFNQLICPHDCVDFYNPKTINSSMGSFTRVKVFRVDLNQFYEQNELPVFAADMNGESIAKRKFVNPSVFVMGSESQGISALSHTKVRDYISIPRFGKAESLNVGIATGIIASYLRMS